MRSVTFAALVLAMALPVAGAAQAQDTYHRQNYRQYQYRTAPQEETLGTITVVPFAPLGYVDPSLYRNQMYYEEIFPMGVRPMDEDDLFLMQGDRGLDAGQ